MIKIKTDTILVYKLVVLFEMNVLLGVVNG